MTGRKKIIPTEYQLQKISLLYGDGLSVERIGRSVNLSVGTVNRIIKEHRMGYDMEDESHFELPTTGPVEPAKEEMTLDQRAKLLASKIISINNTLETIKPLYAELDAAVLELKDLIGLNRYYIEGGTQIGVQIVDEFEEKNTIWRIQKSQRFIAKFETLEDRQKKAEKEARAAEKALKALAKK